MRIEGSSRCAKVCVMDEYFFDFFLGRSTVRIGGADVPLVVLSGHWQARQIHYFPHIATPAKDGDTVQAKMGPLNRQKFDISVHTSDNIADCQKCCCHLDLEKISSSAFKDNVG